MDSSQTSVKVVTFYPEKYVPPISSNMPIKLDNFELQPGENEVTENDFKQLEKHPDFIFWLRQGAFAVATKTTTIGVETVTEVPPAVVTLSDDEIIAEAKRRGILAAETSPEFPLIQSETTESSTSEASEEGDSSNLETELGDPSKKATIRKK